MSRRLDTPNACGGTTDHGPEIAHLREMADVTEDRADRLAVRLAADLLEAHDQTGISLDDWPTARQFVEMFLGTPVLPSLI